MRYREKQTKRLKIRALVSWTYSVICPQMFPHCMRVFCIIDLLFFSGGTVLKFPAYERVILQEGNKLRYNYITIHLSKNLTSALSSDSQPFCSVDFSLRSFVVFREILCSANITLKIWYVYIEFFLMLLCRHHTFLQSSTPERKRDLKNGCFNFWQAVTRVMFGPNSGCLTVHAETCCQRSLLFLMESFGEINCACQFPTWFVCRQWELVTC